MSYGSMSVTERRLMPPAVAVSTVAFALHPPEGARLGCEAASSVAGGSAPATLWLPLVRRTRPPFADRWALPGGPIPWDETLVDTALRTLRAAVRRDPGYLEQLYSFGAVERSADAQRLVTIAYWALYGEQDLLETPRDASIGSATASTGSATAPTGSAAPRPDSSERSEPARRAQPDDPNIAWFSADKLPPLAFDHAEIVAYALDRLRSKTEYGVVAYRFLGRSFTLAQLREVREAILGETIDPANFRRQALSQGHLIDTGEQTSGARHRPARLYRFRATAESPADRPSDTITDLQTRSAS